MPKVKFGDTMKEWRLSKLLSQKDLASSMRDEYGKRFSVRAVQYVESGRFNPSFRMLKAYQALVKKYQTRSLAEAKREVAKLEAALTKETL